MDGVDIFRCGLSLATAIVKQVRNDQFANATPDSEWNVRDLLGHMLRELDWVPDLLEGKTIAEVGTAHDGDLIGPTVDDLSQHWQAAADAADKAIDEADPDEIAHLSYGEVNVDEYLRQAGTDQLIHAWDLGKAIGVAVQFDFAASQTIYDDLYLKRDEMSKTGLFAAEVSVPESAGTQTKLLALFGRHADWQAPSLT